MDGEFKRVKQKLLSVIEVNITSKNEHVPEIGRKIRHIKEKTQCIKAELPYSVMTGQMIKRMVLHAVLLINSYVDKRAFLLSTFPENLF